MDIHREVCRSLATPESPAWTSPTPEPPVLWLFDDLLLVTSCSQSVPAVPPFQHLTLRQVLMVSRPSLIYRPKVTWASPASPSGHSPSLGPSREQGKTIKQGVRVAIQMAVSCLQEQMNPYRLMADHGPPPLSHASPLQSWPSWKAVVVPHPRPTTPKPFC